MKFKKLSGLSLAGVIVNYVYAGLSIVGTAIALAMMGFIFKVMKEDMVMNDPNWTVEADEMFKFMQGIYTSLLIFSLVLSVALVVLTFLYHIDVIKSTLAIGIISIFGSLIGGILLIMAHTNSGNSNVNNQNFYQNTPPNFQNMNNEQTPQNQ